MNVVVDMDALNLLKALKPHFRCAITSCASHENITLHHVEPAGKIESVSKLALIGSVEDVIAEIKKCVPICLPHHKQIHGGQIKGWLIGRFSNGTWTQNATKAQPHLQIMAQLVDQLYAASVEYSNLPLMNQPHINSHEACPCSNHPQNNPL